MTPFRNLAGLLLAVALSGVSQGAAAEVFRCKNAAGAVEFSDRPCSDQASGRKNAKGAQCQGPDGQWYPYGDQRCVATGPAPGSETAQDQEKAEATRYLRCATLRAKPDKLRDTAFSAFREICVDAPGEPQQERGPTGPRTRWEFRSYELDLYTQGDRIIDFRKH